MKKKILVADQGSSSFEYFRENLLQDIDVELIHARSNRAVSNAVIHQEIELILAKDSFFVPNDISNGDSKDVSLVNKIPVVMYTTTMQQDIKVDFTHLPVLDLIPIPLPPGFLNLKIKTLLATIEQNKALMETNASLTSLNNTLESLVADYHSNINYARNIQGGLLPGKEKITNIFPNHFILYEPKDVVGGDFYYFEEINNTRIAVVADCVGHGVPGALLSMLGTNLLTDATVNQRLINPADILQHINKGLKSIFNKSNDVVYNHDGIDMAICCFDKSSNIMSFAGAHRPLIIANTSETKFIKGDTWSVGNGSPHECQYTTHQIDMNRGDVIYMFSDGYPDQFGGERFKKFTLKKLMELISTVSRKSMQEQHQILKEAIHLWKGGSKQIDDILLAGIRYD